KKLPFQAEQVQLTHWLGDSTHSNFFNQWLEDSKDIERIPGGGIGGSIYDAAVLVNLDAEGQAFWYSRKSHYLEIDDLEKAGPDTLLPVKSDGSVEINIGMRLHQVSLLTLRPEGATAVSENKEISFENKIKCSIFPNPFNQRTVIQLNSVAGEVEIAIYNQLGQLVFRDSKTIADSDNFQFVWNGRNISGQALPSGVYFLKVKSSRQVLVKKMLLLR
ncbi:MAG: T9SS type A sorting domain-containing protein, partial [Calditrichaeota bacterium]|nr:T9SS type A sorting domain-containing protein [Calditrichota bacterium]